MLKPKEKMNEDEFSQFKSLLFFIFLGEVDQIKEILSKLSVK
jgi:hypothetical protein